MEFHLLTAASEKYRPLAEITAPTKLNYALLRGYSFTSRVHNPEFSPFKPGWEERPRFMLQTLSGMQNGDWLWFTGADAAVMDSEVHLESFIEREPEADLLMPTDGCMANNDSMLIRCCSATMHFLVETIRRREKGDANDQTAMFNVIRAGGVRTAMVPMRWFNSFFVAEAAEDHPNAYRPGDFVLQTPEFPFETRLKVMREYVDKYAK